MEIIDYVSMGKRIRKYRMAKGMSQSDLAEAVQRSNTTISHIEVGSGKPYCQCSGRFYGYASL